MQILQPTGKYAGIKPQATKAIRIQNYGGPGVLQYEDAPLQGELLIRVNATGVTRSIGKCVPVT
jgi:hypothetical protein